MSETINETPYLTTNDKTETTINEVPYLVTGGGGGTSDYNDLDNKPQINGTELSGDKATSDLFEAGEGISFEDGQIGVDFNITATNTRVNEVESTLGTEISNLKNIGRFCAIWDASAGSPTSEPRETPYLYKVGDYFRIGVKGYKVPTGSQYNPGEYDTVTEETDIGDVWYYDGVEWVKQASSGGGTVQDVQVAGTSVLAGGIANVPIATTTTLGVVKPAGYGVNVNPQLGNLIIDKATNQDIDAKTTAYKPIVPGNLDYAIEKGLGNNSLTWSDAEKTSARTTIGAVGNADYASTATGGVIKIHSGSYATGVNTTGYLVASEKTYEQYQTSGSAAFIGKGTLENVITGKGLVSNTDYAQANVGGVFKTNAGYGTEIPNGYLRPAEKTYAQYESANNNLFIGKGTLENVLTNRVETKTTFTCSMADGTTKTLTLNGTLA